MTIIRHIDSTKITFVTYHGPSRQRLVADLLKHDIVLTTYEVLREDLMSSSGATLYSHHWHRIVLDEGITLPPSPPVSGPLPLASCRNQVDIQPDPPLLTSANYSAPNSVPDFQSAPGCPRNLETRELSLVPHRHTDPQLTRRLRRSTQLSASVQPRRQARFRSLDR